MATDACGRCASPQEAGIRARSVRTTRIIGPVDRSVLLVEDDNLVRAALAAGLAPHGFTVTAVGDARAAMASFESAPPAVAVLDLHLGAGPTGLDLAVAMRERSPSVGLVLLTSFTDPRLLRASLDTIPAGMHYLVKQSIEDLSLLVTVIESAPEAVPSSATAAPRSPLTTAQADTLRLLAAGLSNSEIARVRVVTEATVEKTVARTAQALGIPYADGINQRVALARAYFRLIGRAT
jgi:DNA-binding NarL/FixJ family response regulator